MFYNQTQYNSGEYNLTIYDLSLLETITPADTITKSVSIARAESVGATETIGNYVGLQAFLDELMSLNTVSRLPAQYNSCQYNTSMYNVRFGDDGMTVMVGKNLIDLFTLTDAALYFSINQLLTELLLLSDTLSFIPDILFVEGVFMPDTLRVEVSNKALDATIYLSDWLSIKRNPVNEEWGD